MMCERVRKDGWKIEDAALAAGCSERTCYRWLERFDAGEPMGDRSSAPHNVPGRTPPDVEAAIEQLRRLRLTSTRIAAELDLPVSTVCAVLKRIGLNRLSHLEPLEPPTLADAVAHNGDVRAPPIAVGGGRWRTGEAQR